MVNWGRATVVLGSSSFGSRGLPGRRGWASQAAGHCWEGPPVARCWEAGWPCWHNRAGEEAGGGHPGVRCGRNVEDEGRGGVGH